MTAEEYWHKYNRTKPESERMLIAYHRHVVTAMEKYAEHYHQEQLKSGSSDVITDEEICKMFPMDVLNHDEITMAKREAAKWARDFKAKNRDEGIELTDEIISLIYIGKKMVCEEDCKCHAECNKADEYVNQLKKKN